MHLNFCKYSKIFEIIKDCQEIFGTELLCVSEQ